MSNADNYSVFVDEWVKCYGESWTGVIVPAAMAHPAKFSKALVRRIYDHVIEEGWIHGDIPITASERLVRFLCLNGFGCVRKDVDDTHATVVASNVPVSTEEQPYSENVAFDIASTVNGPSLHRTTNLSNSARGNVSTPTGSGEAESASSTTESSGRRSVNVSEQKLGTVNGAGQQPAYRSTIRLPIDTRATTQGRTYRFYVLPATVELIDCLIESFPSSVQTGDWKSRNGGKDITLSLPDDLTIGDQITVKGSVVVDCFGGVALGAYEAMHRGINWVAVELEPRFVMMGAGGDCPGFTKEQWVKFQRRPNKLQNLCPDCREAMNPGPVDPQVTLFGGHNRQIPTREPHHYTGNIEAWRTLNLPGNAQLIQGDSRKLREVLAGAEKDCALTSPPYVSGGHHNDVMGSWNSNGGGHGVTKDEAGYGRESGQLGQMSEGQPDLAMTSPPYENSVKMRSSDPDEERCREKGLDPSKYGRVAGHGFYSEEYGRTEGQVGGLTAPEGSLEIALTSPPYGQRTVHGQSGIDPSKFQERDRTGHSSQATTQDRYGESDGQLANLAMTSPPFGSSGHSDWHLSSPERLDKMYEAYKSGGGGLSREGFEDYCRRRQGGYGHTEGQLADLALTSPPFSDSVAVAPRANKLMSSVAQNHGNNKARQENCDLSDYGSEPGQLGAMKEGDPTLAIASPPYAGNSGKHDRTGAERAERRHERLGFKQGVGCFKTSEAYGEEEGQLGSMETGDVDIAITSPPYARSLMPDMNDPDKFEAQQARYRENHPEHKRPKNTAPVYGNTPGNLGHITEGTVDAVISSPPYANQNITGRRNFLGGGGNEQPAAAAGRSRQDGYGETPGQLGIMPEGSAAQMVRQSLEDARTRTPCEESLRQRQDEFTQWLHADAAISSPPYNPPMCQDHNGARGGQRGTTPSEPSAFTRSGSSDGQLDGMSMQGFDAAISSPPYAGSDTKPSAMGSGKATRSDGTAGGRNKGDYEYGDAPGQLGRMPEGCISSPSFIDARQDTSRPIPSPAVDGELAEGEARIHRLGACEYGEQDGQLSRMRTGDINGVISSPPYPQSHTGGGGLNVEGYSKDWQKNDLRDMVGRRTYQGRGGDREDGNLETLNTGDIDAVITSPPYEGALHDPGKDLQPRPGDIRSSPRSSQPWDYGVSAGNLGNMKGGFEQALTSPPYEHDSEPHGALRPDEGRQRVVFVERDYGATEGNVSVSPETFWSASRAILEELYQVLAPGAHAVFVCKAFVRNGAIVDFPGQWAMLCQAVGFRWLHDHHALLTEEYATQGGFEEDRTLKSSRKSFFRRLHEQKRPDLAINHESVLCFAKE